MLLVLSALFLNVVVAQEVLPHRARAYDVLHYKVDIRLDEAKKSVSGTTSITLTSLGTSLDSIILDAERLTIQSVSLSGNWLDFSNDSHELTLHLPRPMSPSDTLTIAIAYSCTPTKGLYFIQPDSTDPTRRHQIWTQGEDTDNRYWFPCYDFPDDKATSEIIATVPEEYTLVSNGRMEKATHNSRDRTRTFHWRQSLPHSSYLIMFAAGKYEILRELYGNIPLEYYVYKEYAPDAHRSFAKTPVVMKFLEERIGISYPWEKYAQIFVNQFPIGGMENTTAVTLNEIYMFDERAAIDFTADDVVAHELAHQWWGDLVTCRDWTHLWLNEGFASYFGLLFKEQDRGRDEYRYEMMQQTKSILRTEEYQGRKPIISNDSYTTNVYMKGSWVLSMLRNSLGESDFWKALDLYIRQYSFGNADTHDLQTAVRDATGQNFDWFFDQWLYKAGHPELTVKTRWDNSRNLLTITIAQSQQQDSLTGVFRFPLDIECTTSHGTLSRTVWISNQTEMVEFPLTEKPLMVIVDKGMKLLKAMTVEKSTEEYLYLLSHAEDLSDRIVAARELRRYEEDEDVCNALVQSALHDSFWGVRMEAAVSVGVMKSDGVKEALFEIYRDKKSRVRQAAIIGLEQFVSNEVATFILKAAETDSSYLVLASCITAMERVDSTGAFDFARRYVDLKSYRDIVRLAALGVFRNLRDPRAVPYAVTYASLGHPVDIRTMSVGILGEVGADDPVARTLVERLVQNKEPALRVSAIRALSKWGDEAARAAIEARKSKEDDEDVKKAIEQALDLLSHSLNGNR